VVNFNELLNKRIPYLNKYDNTTTNKDGTVPTYPRDCGRSFEDWVGFEQEVENFYKSDTKILGSLSTQLGALPFIFDTQPCGSELEIHDRIMNNFGKPLKALLNVLGIPSLFKRPGGDSQVLFDPDIVWKIGGEMNNNLGLAIEVKTWWSFDCIEHIVDQYHEDMNKSSKGIY
jgi:hypothetical protein